MGRPDCPEPPSCPLRSHFCFRPTVQPHRYKSPPSSASVYRIPRRDCRKPLIIENSRSSHSDYRGEILKIFTPEERLQRQTSGDLPRVLNRPHHRLVPKDLRTPTVR